MHTNTNIVRAGKPVKEAQKALIMIHGRGGSAEDILTLAAHLQVKEFALLAPQASNYTWYPMSFLAPTEQNEPGLSSALQMLGELEQALNREGISSDNIYFLGFSQGACLTLEYVSRNAKKYGGVVAFTGGLIGNKVESQKYKGDFSNTPVFIGTSDPDPHVPVARVQESEKILENLNAALTVKIYNNMGHTISQNEIELANKLIFDRSA